VGIACCTAVGTGGGAVTVALGSALRSWPDPGTGGGTGRDGGGAATAGGGGGTGGLAVPVEGEASAEGRPTSIVALHAGHWTDLPTRSS
jgi:hypothetical protein